MIRVNENYVIFVDALCYTAKRDLHKTDKEGNAVYSDAIGYYRTLDKVLLAIVGDSQRRFLSEGEHSLEEAIKIISTAHVEFEELLKKVLEDK